jgi:glucokinase
MATYCFGVDIGGTTVKMGLFQTTGELVDKWEIPTKVQNQGEAILPDVSISIEKKLEERGIAKADVAGIGMGVPAPVLREGIVKDTVNLGWGYKEVKRELEELTGLTVHVANDANIAALGEMWKGGGAGYNNLVMVTLGTGVGGGVILDGHILTGVNGGAGEIGHLYVDADETEPCGCGKCGCLEQYASATGIVRIAKRHLGHNQKKTILDVENITAKDVFDAVKAGDEVAKEIAEIFGRYLGYALANVSAVVDVEAFVIGGGVSKAGEVLLGYVKKYYIEKAFWAHRNAEFALAKLGNDAGIYGGAKLALE